MGARVVDVPEELLGRFDKLSNLAQNVGVERAFRGLLLQLGPRISQLARHADTGPREPGEAVDRRSAVRDLDGADAFRTGVRDGLDDPASVFRSEARRAGSEGVSTSRSRW